MTPAKFITNALNNGEKDKVTAILRERYKDLFVDKGKTSPEDAFARSFLISLMNEFKEKDGLELMNSPFFLVWESSGYYPILHTKD